MKKLITGFLICLLFAIQATAQLSFVRVDTVEVTDSINPMTTPWAGGFNFPMFCEVDLNGDSIMDLVVFENGGPPGHSRIMPFVNGGTTGQVDYRYAPQYISHFPDIKGFMITYDYNHDRKMDLFSLSDLINSGIMVYRNDYSTGTGLKFTKVVDPLLTKYRFGSPINIFASQVSVPSLIDVDNDGDMDIISWPPLPNGTLEYQRGLAVDSGWSFDSLRFKNVTTCWGGFALEVGTPYNRVSSFGLSCREGEHGMLTWDEGITARDDTQSIIMLFDNDGDGDKDALVGGYGDNNALLVVNGGTALKDSMVSQDISFPSYDTPVNLTSFPYYFYIDVNNDGKKDLIVTPHSVSNFRGIRWYKNTGTNSSPHFVYQTKTLLQEEMIEVGAGAAPALFDYDGDGLPDLLIGDESYYDPNTLSHKGITAYRNTGTLTSPKFQLFTRDFAQIDVLNGVAGTIYPTFGDIDGDGDIDMITGTGSGTLLYFENTAGPGNPATFIPPTSIYQNIHVGQYSAPQLYDLDHDSLLDLIVGNKAGVIKFYKNTGTANTPVYTLTKDTLGGINTQLSGFITGYASPFFFRNNNEDELILGTESGKLYVYDGISGNIFGHYHLADSIVSGEEGQRLIPFVGDINNDGRPDLLIGNYNGGVALYLNDSPVGVTVFHNEVKSSFAAYPNPASSILTLSFNHTENAHAHIEILNSTGQLIYKSAVTGLTMNVSLGNYSAGVYLVRFVSDDNMQMQKVVVAKKSFLVPEPNLN